MNATSSTARRVVPSVVTVRLAANAADEQACRNLMSRVYAENYGVVLTTGKADPDGGLETFPDRFVMGEANGELVACAGLYTRETYIERYGDVTHAEIVSVARGAEITDAHRRRRYEYTKVVVHPSWSQRGLGRRFIASTHARDFLCVDSGEAPPLLLVCARLSTFKLWEAVGIRTRSIKPFPTYSNHARYRSALDPVESRLVVPERDVDRRWYEMKLPGHLELSEDPGLP